VRGGELNRWWRVGIPIVAPLVRLLFRVRVEGIEHVPLSGSAILAFNHVSALDGPVLAIETAHRIKRTTRFLVGAEFFGRPFYGWVLRRYEQIPIRRGEGDGQALDAAVATVRDGALVAIAPEGRVGEASGSNGLQPMRSGAARIALPTGAPVIPVGIWGTQRRYPKSGFTIRRPLHPSLGIVFGDPILPAGELGDDVAVESFKARLRARLESEVARARQLAGESR
jgi:1-acyl-sn-glycerol-3-phosphate acyltransferase